MLSCYQGKVLELPFFIFQLIKIVNKVIKILINLCVVSTKEEKEVKKVLSKKQCANKKI